ncbi:MAG: hypothetical protein Sylvanvirus18_3 [Sylvanvirus sp.]|uniref:Uncharacterized protein n=1 Tax=Sylvanvirus sp. TaxID=2487774 RepID=A0A3G5AIJ2_9VIRU|nr:MAG: hypothetical protein Sylvanvirus18_3 [Sylvanvirus sp.]
MDSLHVISTSLLHTSLFLSLQYIFSYHSLCDSVIWWTLLALLLICSRYLFPFRIVSWFGLILLRGFHHTFCVIFIGCAFYPLWWTSFVFFIIAYGVQYLWKVCKGCPLTRLERTFHMEVYHDLGTYTEVIGYWIPDERQQIEFMEMCSMVALIKLLATALYEWIAYNNLLF